MTNPDEEGNQTDAIENGQLNDTQVIRNFIESKNFSCDQVLNNVVPSEIQESKMEDDEDNKMNGNVRSFDQVQYLLNRNNEMKNTI